MFTCVGTLNHVFRGITYDAVEAAFVGYCYGESTSGQVRFSITRFFSPVSLTCSIAMQSALYHLGMTGIPITNVNNNCSTGSTALVHAGNAVKTSLVECALALGFERMAAGSLTNHFPDRLGPMFLLGSKTIELEETLGENIGPVAPRMFENAGKEYCVRYGANVEHFAKIGAF